MRHLVCFFFLSTVAYGQSTEVRTAPPPPWRKTITFSLDPKDTSFVSGGYFELLREIQHNTTVQESYYHYAQKVISEGGLEPVSTISQDFDPSYQTLTFHSLEVVRNGLRINQLSKGSFEVMRRETSMDSRVYDKNLTAVFNITDLRMGDIVEYAFTLKGANPLFGGRFARLFYFNSSIPLGQVYFRVITSTERKAEVRSFNNPPEGTITQSGDKTEYEWSRTNVPALLSDESSPGWFDPYDHVQIATYGSWSDLAKWAAKLYPQNTNQQLLKRIQIKAATRDDSIRQIIRFVQDEIRYLSFSDGINGYKPHNPASILDQRFGDCKDKSLLLSTLLREAGIESHPVLVNTTYGKELPQYLPAPGQFDHCVVNFKLRDSVIWVDPTYNFQRGPLQEISFPNYHFGLIIDANERGLTSIPAPQEAEQITREDFYLEEVGGAASLRVKTTYDGREANYIRQYFNSSSKEEIEKQYLNYYASDYPDVHLKDPITWTDNEVTNVLISEESYELPSFWQYDSVKAQYSVSFYPRNLASYLTKPETKIRTSPYALNFPRNITHEITIHLPETWNVTNATNRFGTPAFSYESQVKYADKTIWLRFKYKALRPHVEKLEIKNYVAQVDAALNDLNFTLTRNSDSSAPSQTTNSPFLVILLISLIPAYFIFRQLYFHDPEPKPAPESYNSIGGWLILPAIGLCISPILVFRTLLDVDYFAYSNWQMIADREYSSFNPELGLLVLCEMILNSWFLIFNLGLIVLFFRRRSSVPHLAAGFYIWSFVFLTADTLLASTFSVETAQKEVYSIVRSLIGAIIWAPYFLFSQRSKGTFTVRLPMKIYTIR